MSRVFAAAIVALVFTAGAGAIGLAQDRISSPPEEATAIGDIFVMSIEFTQAVPIVLVAAALLATLGVMSRA